MKTLIVIVSLLAIGYAVLAAAEAGQMTCFRVNGNLVCRW